MTPESMVSVGDIAEVFDGPHATPKKLESGPYFLSISSLIKGALDLSQSAHLSEEDFKKWTKRVTPEPGDILFSYETRLGEAAMMPTGIRACLGRRMGLLRPDRTRVLPKYLLYAYLSPDFQSTIEQRKIHGATVDRIALKELPSFPIRVPSIAEQRFIVDNLKTLDEKIQLNHQINQTLEQMAQAIFKSWFVDFEPVKAKIAALEAGGSEDDALLAAMQAIAGSALFATDAADTDAQTQLARLQTEHPEQYTTLRATAELFPSAMQESELGEIPEGWEAGSIGDVATARGGYAFKGSQFEEYGNPVVKIKNIVGDGTVKLTGTQCVDDAVAETAYRFQLNDGDLVMAMTGATVGKTGLVLTLGEKVLLNQRVAVFQSKYFGSKISWFLFCLFARKDIFDVVVGTAQGSAQPNISSSGIEAVPIVVPAYEVLEQYLSVTDGLFKFWLENNRQSENLSSLRDTLLPKLLSGELSVSAATDQITKAEEAIDV